MEALALGADKVVASINIETAPAMIFVEAERLEATGGNPKGGPDADGFELHCLYEGRKPKLLQESDGARKVLRARFDAQRVIIVPFCGDLKLVGGAGSYRFSIAEPLEWKGAYQPIWHTLTRFVERSRAFRVPDGHTMIGSLNPGATITSEDGDIWALDGSMKPIGAGTEGTVGPNRGRIFTASFW